MVGVVILNDVVYVYSGSIFEECVGDNCVSMRDGIVFVGDG